MACRKFLRATRRESVQLYRRSLRKAVEVDRKRLDIRDFLPSGLPQLRSGQEPWVATGKHLCGVAADFALRCCVQHGAAAQDGDADAAENVADSRTSEANLLPSATRSLCGLAFATCCHHRCIWEDYVGQRAMRDLDFSPEEFEIVSWMTGERFSLQVLQSQDSRQSFAA